MKWFILLFLYCNLFGAAVPERFFAGATKVLDVGCGDGSITAELAKEYPQIIFVGCDVSKEEIQKASKRYNYPNLSFVVKDATTLGSEAEFDRIVSFSTLHWIEDQKKALSSIYAALKPQGKAFISASPKTSHNDFKTASMKVIMSFKWLSHFVTFKSTNSFHSERDYKKILKGIGFSVDRIEQKNHETRFANRDELNAFLREFMTPVAHLPESKRGSFLDDYYEALVDLGNVDEEKVIHIHFDKIEFEVSKI